MTVAGKKVEKEGDVSKMVEFEKKQLSKNKLTFLLKKSSPGLGWRRAMLESVFLHRIQ